MSLITYNGLVELVAQGVLTPVPPEHINGASIDVRLGGTFAFESGSERADIVDLSKKESPVMHLNECHTDVVLYPSQFCLASTMEIFNLPNDIACEFRLKSSVARAGLDQALAVWCDPGWHGSTLTMELRNNLSHHPLRLTPGMKIGQVIFYQGDFVPREQSYATRGQYNHDKTVTPSKGVR
jgi:dCTP deaminase